MHTNCVTVIKVQNWHGLFIDTTTWLAHGTVLICNARQRIRTVVQTYKFTTRGVEIELERPKFALEEKIILC